MSEEQEELVRRLVAIIEESAGLSMIDYASENIARAIVASRLVASITTPDADNLMVPAQTLLERIKQDGILWKSGFDAGLQSATSDRWEWGVRDNATGHVKRYTNELTREDAEAIAKTGDMSAVCRRPAGQWGVATDD